MRSAVSRRGVKVWANSKGVCQQGRKGQDDGDRNRGRQQEAEGSKNKQQGAKSRAPAETSPTIPSALRRRAERAGSPAYLILQEM